MSSVRIVVSRRLWHGGRSLVPGDIVDCNEREAVALLEAGGAQLCDPADAPRVRAFALGELRRILARAGPPGPAPGSPWGPWQR